MPDGPEPVNPPLPDPPDETPRLPESTGIRFQAERWRAPLPPPAVLQQYEAIFPGAAELIFDMAKNQHQHRIEQEKAVVAQGQYALETARITHNADASRSKLGLIFAFIISLFGISASAGLITIGEGGLGLGFLFAPLATLAGAFIYTARARRANRRRNPQNDETG